MIRLPPKPTLFPYTTLFRSNRREEIDALSRRLDRVDEERRRLETAIAESNTSIHAVDREAKRRTDELTSKVDIDVATLAQRGEDRKSTRLNSSHANISYAVF